MTPPPLSLPPASNPLTKLNPRQQGQDAARTLVVFVLVVTILYFGREVLIPITLALMLTFLLATPVGWCRRIYLGRVPAVVLVVTAALVILFGIGGVIVGEMRELATDLPKYASTIETKVTSIKAETFGLVSHAIRGATAVKALPGPQDVTAAHQGLPALPAQTAKAAPPSGFGVSASGLPSPWQLAAQYISPIMSPLATIFIVFVVAVFALLQREDLRDRLIRLIGPDDIHRTTVALDDAGRRLTRYFLTQLAVNTVFGIVIGIGLSIIGVPRPILWGVIATVLRFIPYIGSIIAAALPIALAAAVTPGWSTALYTLGFYVVTEGVTGQFLEPLFYGQSSGLSPFSVIVAAIFWSWLWGPVGLFLATPLTLCLAVLGRHVKGLELLDVMLGDRPPLTPTESFYQRILADDADEILDQAELMLRDMPLCRYYDEVALPGMQLAAKDAELGILTAKQQENIQTTLHELVDGLTEQLEKRRASVKPPSDAASLAQATSGQPAPEPARPITVLSLAGRGPLDEPAAGMLVQLFKQSGFNSRLIRYREASRNSIETVDITDVAIVCIAYLNISGSPAHLRYLVQRLRSRLPTGTPILVGLWSTDDPAIRADATRAALGADLFTSSFEEVLRYCQAAANQANRMSKPGLIYAAS